MKDTYSVNKEAPKEAKKYNISPALEGAALGLFALLLTFITAYFIYSNSMDVLQQEIKDGLLRTVSGIVPCLDVDKIEKFKGYKAEDQFKDDYQQMVRLLQKIRIGTKHISFLYINTIVDGKVYYLVDPIPVDEKGKPIYDDEKSNEPSIPMSPYNDPDDILIKCFDENKAYVSDEPYTDEWGTFYSAYAPIVNHEGKVIGTLGADLRINELMDRCHPMVDATKRAFIVSVSLAMLLGTFVWFTRRFTFMLNESRQCIYNNFLVAKHFADQTSNSIGNQFQRTSGILKYTAQKLGILSKFDSKEMILFNLKIEQQKLERFSDKLLTLGELKYSKREKELCNFSLAEVHQQIIKKLKSRLYASNSIDRIDFDIDKELPQIVYGPVVSYEELVGHLYELCLNQFESKVYSKILMIEERSQDVIIRQSFAVSTEGIDEGRKKLTEAICRNISGDNWGEQLELAESINIPIIQELLYTLGSDIKAEIKDDFFKMSFEFILLKSQETEGDDNQNSEESEDSEEKEDKKETEA
jgi:hypothetical protein